jgi:hypothetical protein
MEDIFGSFQVVSNRQVLKYQWTGVSAAMLTDGATTMATPFYHKPCGTEAS